uniref:Cytosolic sulfotransferase 3-like n=1 Tax=Saccoglossus kowalevskii TaxID=10224 RepID=A0ABM0M962_SACKO|nr:PREDICTED: cytosolic sulfotransferase 3-like [Saccoglossus kowalevskii]
MATHVYYQGEYVYRGVIFPGYIRRNLARAFEEQFECRDDDVFIVSYPRSGTTWTTEMVSLVMNGGDTEYNMSDIQHTRVPQIEVNYKPNIMRIKDFRSFNDAFEWSKSIPSPRLMRTHLQYNLFAKEPIKRKCKFIYVARNPKDMLVSYYYFYKMCRVHGCYDGSWAAFFRKFINKQRIIGDWRNHFTLAQNEEFNKLYEYKMKDTGLSFQWDGEN